MLIGHIIAGTMLLLAGTSAVLHIYIHMGLFLGRPRENGTSQNLFATNLVRESLAAGIANIGL